MRQYTCPQLRFPVVDDQDVDQTSVGHFHHVFVFQGVGNDLENRRWFASGPQTFVESEKTFVIARGFAYVHDGAAQRIHVREHRPIQSRNGNLANGSVVLGDEVHTLLTLLRHGEVAGGNVAKPVDQRRQKLVSRGGDQIYGEWTFARLVFLIDVTLEVADQFCRDAALATLVVVEQCAAIWNEYTDHPTLNHGVEVAGPWFRCEAQLARRGRNIGRRIGRNRVRNGAAEKGEDHRA